MTGPRSSRPGWPGRPTPPAASAPRSPRPGPPATSSSPPTWPGSSPRCAGQGTTTVEIKSGYGLTVHDEARSLAIARQVTEETTFLGAHVVPPEYADDPAAYVDLVTGPMLGGLRAARPLDRRVLRARRLRRGPGAGDPRGRSRRRAARRGCTPTSSAPAPAYGWPCEVGLRRASTTAPTSATPTWTRSPTSGTVATLLPGRRVLHPVALPGRPPAARRRRHGGARHRLQPRLLLHLLDAAVHRAGRSGDGDDARPRRCGAATAGGRAAPCGATTSATSASGAGPTWSCSTRRRTCTWPTGPGVPLVRETFVRGRRV